jgi:hypothetical protein
MGVLMLMLGTHKKYRAFGISASFKMSTINKIYSSLKMMCVEMPNIPYSKRAAYREILK